jgi:hypothetical protein
MSKISLPYAAARPLANALVKMLAPACVRIEIAGSVRRQARAVGDLEIVAIPRHGVDLLGQTADSVLDQRLAELVAAGTLARGRCDGPRYKQLEVVGNRGLCLDLFLVTPETWGVILAIRTGPAQFSQALVTGRARGGLLPNDSAVADGRLHRARDVIALRFARDGAEGIHHGHWETLETPEEKDFLARCGFWLEPKLRSAAAVGLLRKGHLPEQIRTPGPTPGATP